MRTSLRALPLRFAALVVIGSLALVGGTRGVLAHAEPEEIRPGDGAVVTAAPVAIEIVMTQELARQPGANDIDVLAADGTEVTTEAATPDLKDRRRISVPLPTNLAPGTYTVKWKTLSAEDGDPEDGELSFTYDPGGVATPGREQLGDVQPVVPTVAIAGNADASPFSNERQSTRDSWVVAAAAALAGLAVGGVLTFLLIQKRIGPSA